jgi:hypothetical protein
MSGPAYHTRSKTRLIRALAEIYPTIEEHENILLEEWMDGASDRFNQDVAALINELRILYFQTFGCVMAEHWTPEKHLEHQHIIHSFMELWMPTITLYLRYEQIFTEGQAREWRRVRHLFNGLYKHSEDMNAKAYTY